MATYTATLPFDRGPRHPIRPVHHSYDPVHTTSDPPKHDLFGFLATAAQDDPALHRSSFRLSPEDLGVSWQTFFPACRQSRQWREAEDAAQELTDRLFRAGDSCMSDFCKHWRDLAEILQLVETAVACTVYMYPRADVVRIRLLAQLHVVMWIHDDVPNIADCHQEELQQGRRSPPTPTRTSCRQGTSPICRLISTVLHDILQADSMIGSDVAAGALKWHQMSRAHCSKDQDNCRPTALSEYLKASVEDATTDVNLAMIRFAGSIHLTSQQGQDPILKCIVDLWAKHLVIVKDLFSYEKDCLEHKVNDSAVVNAIQVLQSELNISLRAAKEVARNIQLDTEREMHGLYQEILGRTGTDSPEARYVRALLESLAGNVFYSSTAERNAMPLLGKSAEENEP
ncbi:isoprenoid synthase domain-containing protein [Aspergillus pseudotamarii]|uniref:Isoprenoid synthase domain-containing protein n=1 Tax=Aspergillus pseudotamarii TaxID=132259 RepID=A0A5N6SN63_ASPPS|nr:isoprenoid synthase domain-containing protein [Aspergillus pseudotamarii]KAE8136122.1 isoprenoid synthase domain-containing protein [Aspergillus pseudotamarii]